MNTNSDIKQNWTMNSIELPKAIDVFQDIAFDIAKSCNETADSPEFKDDVEKYGRGFVVACLLSHSLGGVVVRYKDKEGNTKEYSSLDSIQGFTWEVDKSK